MCLDGQLCVGMDKYDYVTKIGAGSYGEVSLVKEKKDGKRYVVKKVSLLGTFRERKAAQLEVKLLQTLKHPNIVAYHDSFQTNEGSLIIVMAYCEGGDLCKYLRAQKEILEEQQLVEWLVQICMALQYLHTRNILHRDLKTQNIFLTSTHIIKLGDLGIARVLDSASDLATTVIGTPYYMSPELFRNTPYGKESDVWALGCCTFEMMTRRHAFNARDINSLAMKVLRGKSPRMPDAYSKKLTDLVTRMLSFDSENRPTVANILQQRFIRDRIKIFLNKQRPLSGKSKRKTPSPPPSALPPKAPPAEAEEADFDTMLPQLGTINQMAKKGDGKIDPDAKSDHLNRFLSDAAVSFVHDQNNQVNPETFIVQKNVSQIPQNYPIVDNGSQLDTSLSSTSKARERRRQQRIKDKNQSIDEGQSFLELLHGTMKEPVIDELSEKDEKSVADKPALLAGDQTMSSVSRVANRMGTLQRELYNELGSQQLSLALAAVALDDDTEMWRRLNEILPENDRYVWAARVYTLLLLQRALDKKPLY